MSPHHLLLILHHLLIIPHHLPNWCAQADGLTPPVYRGPEEADAENVRVAVLLDELDFPGVHHAKAGNLWLLRESGGFPCAMQAVSAPSRTISAFKHCGGMCPEDSVTMLSSQ